MPNGNKLNSDDPFLTAQQKRILAARAKMAARQELLRAREKRETEKLYRLAGEACCKAAERAEFAPVVKDILEACSDERAKEFLQQKGML